MKRIVKLVEGMRVALVGNSAAIFEKSEGDLIDMHDVVIRMNLGLPCMMHGAERESLGRRTDIWACARYWPKTLDKIDTWPELMVWMKLTSLGRKELLKLRERTVPCPLIVWPQRLENECRRFVGSDPSTGIRMAWFLKTKSRPHSISIFGMDHWQNRPTHWSGRMNTPSHDPEKERLAMKELGL